MRISWPRIARVLVTDPMGGSAILILAILLTYCAYLLFDPTLPYEELGLPSVMNERGAPMQIVNGAYQIAAGETVIVERRYCLTRRVRIELQRVFSTNEGLRHFVPEARLDELHATPYCSSLRALLPIPVYLPSARWTERLWVDAQVNQMRHVRYEIAPVMFEITPPRWETMTEQLRAVLRQIDRRLGLHEVRDREETIQRKILAVRVQDLQRQVDLLEAKVRTPRP